MDALGILVMVIVTTGNIATIQDKPSALPMTFEWIAYGIPVVVLTVTAIFLHLFAHRKAGIDVG